MTNKTRTLGINMARRCAKEKILISNDKQNKNIRLKYGKEMRQKEDESEL